MELKLTDEQLNMLLENKDFIAGLTKEVGAKLTDSSWGCKNYDKLVDKLVDKISKDIKHELTVNIVKNRLGSDDELTRTVDQKVEKCVEKIITTTIGRMIFKELMQKEDK